jgi:phosphate:Na+ symporter
MAQTGVQRALGARLRSILGAALGNRFKAFLAGMGVTALLQSSTATGLMVGGFVGDRLVGLAPALAVMLGANVGTTLVVQLLSFNAFALAPILVLAGVLLFQRGRPGWREFGRVLIGLGLILIALHQFVDLLGPATAAPLARAVLHGLSSHIVFNVLIAATLAWAAHSSVAVILLSMSFAAHGIIPTETAFALVLGANLGAAINPVLEIAAGADRAARRLPIGNLINRTAGVLAVLAVFPYVRLLAAIEPSPARAVADFHTAFNLLLAVLFFPWVKTYAKLLERLIPAGATAADPAAPLYLEPHAQETPPVALGAAAREALRMADVLEVMLRGARSAFEKTDRREIGDIQQTDDILDKLNRAIKAYVSSLDPGALSDSDQARIDQILTFVTNIEQAGDAIDKGLLGLIAKRLKRDLTLSADAQAGILDMLDRLTGNLRTAAALFISGDERGARLLVREKEAFRQIEAAATARHFAQLRAGDGNLVETSALYLDALRDLKRINTHLVESAAYPILQAAGDLLPSRLREEAQPRRP